MGTSLPNLCPLQRPNSPTAALCLKVDWNRRRDGFLLFEDEVRAVNALLGKGRAISIPQPADSAYYRLIYTTLASLTWAMSLLDNNAGCSWPLRGEGRSEGGAQGHSKNITFILHRAALAAGLIPSPPSANLLLCKAESSHNQTTSALMEIFFFVNKETKTVSLSRSWGCAMTCLAVLIWDGSSSQGVFAEERLCLEGHWIWMWFCVHRSQCHF